MSIGRVCQRDVDIVGPTDSVLIAAERMRQRMVGCLVVVEQGQMPVGILTDRDLIIRVLAEERDPRATTVGDVMTRFPDLAQEDMPIESALIKRFESWPPAGTSTARRSTCPSSKASKLADRIRLC
jgi:CBS domain-containing protein